MVLIGGISVACKFEVPSYCMGNLFIDCPFVSLRSFNVTALKRRKWGPDINTGIMGRTVEFLTFFQLPGV